MYSFSILLFEQFNVWCVVVNQKVSFLWRCWCESYQSFIDYILSRKLFTNIYSKHQFLWAIVYRERGNWRLLVLVEHWFLFYVCSAVNFEKFPTDPEDVKDKDNQARHSKDLAQAEKRKGRSNYTGWSKQHKIPPISDTIIHQTWTGHGWYLSDHKSGVFCRVSSWCWWYWRMRSVPPKLFSCGKLPKI